MNNIKSMMQKKSSKSLELLSKLQDTSDGSLKTRDRLLSELTQDLQQMMVLERHHLFPVLRKHEDLKGLVDDTLRDQKETKSLLAELERTPRDSEEFGQKAAILRKTFQQHVRDEKKELLPAIAKALSDEEAATLVETLDDSRAKLEEARHAEAEQRRADMRKEHRPKKRSAAGRAKLEEARRAEAQQRRTVARKEGGSAERSTAGRGESLQKSTGRVAQVVGHAVEEAGEATQRASDNLRAVSQSGEVYGRGISSISREWSRLSHTRVQRNLDDISAVFRSRTLSEMVEAQSAMVRHNFEMMAENIQRITSLTGRMTSGHPKERKPVTNVGRGRNTALWPSLG